MGQLRKDIDELEAIGELGDWCFLNDDAAMFLRYPDGSDRGDFVFLWLSTPEKPNPKTPTWGWDGNKEAPTLTPSIGIYGPNWTKWKWHGYLRQGKLENA